MKRLGIIALMVFTLIVCIAFTRKVDVPKTVSVTLPDGFVVLAEVVTTQEAQAKGLSGRASMLEDQGMLFVFERADRYPFWMKDMLIPIDIVWLSGDQVVDVTANVPVPTGEALPTYAPQTPSDHVLELSAGAAERHSIRINSTLSFD